MLPKELITIVFTFNECENIERVIRNYFDILKDQEMLVVDDDSPDGTASIVKRLSSEYKGLFLLHRKKNRGRGCSARDAFFNVLNNFDSKYIVQMDGDLSHHPETIPIILKSLKKHDVVIASRFLKKGKDKRKDLLRRSLSRLSNIWLAFLFGYNIKDKTSGFSGYKREVIQKIAHELKAKGPEIIEETFYFLKKYNFNIKEISYEFYERSAGETKLDLSKLIKCFIASLRLKIFGSL